MTATPQQETQPPRSGRQLAAFGFLWLSVMLLILAASLAIMKAGRLIRWTKADAEVQGAEVYSVIQRAGRGRPVWQAAVTIRYPVNGVPMVTTVDRGFQSSIRSWMEHWAKQYRAGSLRKILFNPADPLEADLEGEWSLASFSSPVEFTIVAGLFLWGWSRMRRAVPGNLG